jgi:hypothetical protein
MDIIVGLVAMLTCQFVLTLMAVWLLGDIRRRQIMMMEGQTLMMEVAAEAGKFFGTIQNVQVMARRDMDEETVN